MYNHFMFDNDALPVYINNLLIRRTLVFHEITLHPLIIDTLVFLQLHNR